MDAPLSMSIPVLFVDTKTVLEDPVWAMVSALNSPMRSSKVWCPPNVHTLHPTHSRDPKPLERMLEHVPCDT